MPFSSIQQSSEIWTTPLSSTELSSTSITPKCMLSSPMTNRAQSRSTEVPPKCQLSYSVEQFRSTDRRQNAPIDDTGVNTSLFVEPGPCLICTLPHQQNEVYINTSEILTKISPPKPSLRSARSFVIPSEECDKISKEFEVYKSQYNH